MDKRPEPPPWGKLITDALERSGLSARKAAGKVPLSEGRWRQIVSGYQNVSKGVYAPVRGPAETLARMAQVVGVTPEQLAEADREDAAAELRAMTELTGDILDRLEARTEEDLADLAAMEAELNRRITVARERGDREYLDLLLRNARALQADRPGIP